MKLKKFFEYAQSENDNYVDFNDNELKYLDSKGFLIKIQNKYYFNGKEVKKLSSGEYSLFYDDIMCSTIQSLIKYTEEFIKPLNDWFDNILLNSIIKPIDKNNKEWYYNGKLWATQNLNLNNFNIYSKEWLHIRKYFNNIDRSLITKDFILYRLEKTIGLKLNKTRMLLDIDISKKLNIP